MSKSRNIADLGSNDIIETSGSGTLLTGTKTAVVSTSNSYGQFRVLNSGNGEASIGFANGVVAGTELSSGVPTANNVWAAGINVYGCGLDTWGIGNYAKANWVQKVDSAGVMSLPYQPSFLASIVTAQTKTVGWTNISPFFTTTSFNIGSHYNAVNGRFTAPKTGRYMFSCGGYFVQAGTGSERFAFSFVVNGGARPYISGGNRSALDSPVSGHTIVYNLNAGDYVDINMYSPDEIQISSNYHYLWWTGYLLG